MSKYSDVFFGVENRKKLAKKWKFNEQEIVDMPKKELHTLYVGVNRGKELAAEEIKGAFFCIPIEVYNHRKDDFNALMKECIDEMSPKTETEEFMNKPEEPTETTQP